MPLMLVKFNDLTHVARFQHVADRSMFYAFYTGVPCSLSTIHGFDAQFFADGKVPTCLECVEALMSGEP